MEAAAFIAINLDWKTATTYLLLFSPDITGKACEGKFWFDGKARFAAFGMEYDNSLSKGLNSSLTIWLLYCQVLHPANFDKKFSSSECDPAVGESSLLPVHHWTQLDPFKCNIPNQFAFN